MGNLKLPNGSSLQFSSVAQSCPTLCDPMNRSTPGLLVHHQLPEFSNSCPSSRWCHPAISSSIVPFSSYPQSLPASGSFPMSQLFTWGGQSTGVSALVSFLPKKSQGWSPSEWTGWISLQSKYHICRELTLGKEGVGLTEKVVLQNDANWVILNLLNIGEILFYFY